MIYELNSHLCKSKDKIYLGVVLLRGRPKCILIAFNTKSQKGAMLSIRLFIKTVKGLHI